MPASLPPPAPRPAPAGTFTNQIQKGFEEPRLLITTDPRTDHQSIKEAAYMNIPVIAFCDTDSDLQVGMCECGCVCGWVGRGRVMGVRVIGGCGFGWEGEWVG